MCMSIYPPEALASIRTVLLEQYRRRMAGEKEIEQEVTPNDDLHDEHDANVDGLNDVELDST